MVKERPTSINPLTPRSDEHAILPNIVVINITNLYGNVLQLKERIDHQILKVKGVTSTSCNKD